MGTRLRRKLQWLKRALPIHECHILPCHRYGRGTGKIRDCSVLGGTELNGAGVAGTCSTHALDDRHWTAHDCQPPEIEPDSEQGPAEGVHDVPGGQITRVRSP